MRPVKLAVLIAVTLAMFAGNAFADDDSVAAARSVIQSQADAIGHDDAGAAYSYAAPQIRGIFSNADTFLAMVRNSYGAIYRHRSFEFAKSEIVDGKVAQQVRIIDNDGEPWDALYTLERQPDGSMKIVGCVLVKAGQAV